MTSILDLDNACKQALSLHKQSGGKTVEVKHGESSAVIRAGIDDNDKQKIFYTLTEAGKLLASFTANKEGK